MSRHLLLVAPVAAFALTGCGYNCQDTCRHVYAESECAVSTPGITAESSIADCESRCEDALSHTGDQGVYDPYVPNNGAVAITLDNDEQAAAWMDCVWTTAPAEGPDPGCKFLQPEEGFCAPI